MSDTLLLVWTIIGVTGVLGLLAIAMFRILMWRIDVMVADFRADMKAAFASYSSSSSRAADPEVDSASRRRR